MRCHQWHLPLQLIDIKYRYKSSFTLHYYCNYLILLTYILSSNGLTCDKRAKYAVADMAFWKDVTIETYGHDK